MNETPYFQKLNILILILIQILEIQSVHLKQSYWIYHQEVMAVLEKRES